MKKIKINLSLSSYELHGSNISMMIYCVFKDYCVSVILVSETLNSCSFSQKFDEKQNIFCHLSY